MKASAALKTLALLLLVPVLATCGGKKNRSASASEWSVLPEEPIVILGPTKDMLGNDVAGPWFEFRLKVDNKDEEDNITILALEVTVEGTDATGMPFKVSQSFSPSLFDYSKTVNDTTVFCLYSTFGSFAPNTTENYLILDNGNADCGANRQVYFKIGNLSRKNIGDIYNYTVTVRPLGWFGTSSEPKDRYDTEFNFSTR